jgi:acetyltransferase
MSTYRLESVLAPRSVALVGASPRRGSLGKAILANLRQARFAGEIGVVNPNHPEIDNTVTAAALAKLPFVPDLIVVTAPAKAIPEIIQEAGELGVAGAVIISAGLGHGERSLADATNKAARAHKMRVIGPNCLGIMLPPIGLNASFAAHMPRDGGLALISQSGGIAAGMVDWAAQKHVGFSGIVSIGDQLDVDVADLLDYFAVDANTSAILLYVEDVKNGRKFMSAARAAARVKPVVVVKSGRMAQGAKAAATHTGALAGSDAVYDAAFRRAGMLRVFDLRELFDCAEIVGRVKAPQGNRLSILTNGGGLGILAVDRLVELGGEPAELTPDVRAQLDAVLPSTWSKSNPVDIVGDADPSRYAVALDLLLRDPASDGVLVMNVQTAVASAAEIATAVAQVVTTNRSSRVSEKPVLSVWVGADQKISETFVDSGIPDFATEDDAVRGFMYLAHHSEVKEALSAVPPNRPDLFVADIAVARAIIERALGEGRRWLDPLEIKEVLSAYKIPFVATFAAADAEGAAASAAPFLESGQSVAVKIFSRDIVHKSDVGGVVLNLKDADAVRKAANDILARVRSRRPDAKISGVIVQPMISRPNARELIVGIADDPTFGPVIVFGRGGTAVEIVNDKSLGLPPLDLNLARDQIGRTKVSRLLQAYRDVPAVDQDEIAIMLVALAQLAADIPEVRELDINPLLADERGVLAVDARIAIDQAERKFTGPGNARFAVRPYPSQWIRELTLREGKRLRVRPIRPEDEPAILEFLQHVSREDLRLRFFAPMKEFTHAFIARLTQLDYARAMAFLAFDDSDELIGVVRIHSDSVYETGEYAILLRSDRKGRGYGWALMELIIDYARSEGLQRIAGQVLQENTVMLDMCRELGFQARIDPTDSSLQEVTLMLTAPS